MFEEIATFIALVDYGGFSKTSVRLNMSQGAISKRLAKLESNLGTLLIHRDTRNINLTTDGILLYNKFKNIRKALDDFVFESDNYNKSSTSEKIDLTICLHSTISYELICPYLKYYTKQFPHVCLNLIFYSVDLVNNFEFDIAISEHKIEYPNYIVKPIRKDSIKLFCTPRYIIQHGMPRTLDELSNLDIIAGLDNINCSFNPINSILMVNKYTEEKVQFTIKRPSLRTNSASHAKKIGMSNDMIFACWESLCEQDVINGRIIPVLPEYEIPISSTFYLLHKQELGYEAKMFCDFILKCMEKSLSINYLTDIVNNKL